MNTDQARELTKELTKELAEAVREAERAWGRVRDLLADDAEPEDDTYARRMLSVLAEVDLRGGRVGRRELLNIGEGFGYRRRGMAGFYQDLLLREGEYAVLTDVGRERLATLRSLYEELTPPPLSAGFWRSELRGDPGADAFVRYMLDNDRPGSGVTFRAEDAKRELYRKPS